MATSVITGSIKDPAGTALQYVVVKAELRPRPAFKTSTGAGLIVTYETVTDSSGNYSFTLERTADITPANSTYVITEYVGPRYGGAVKHVIQVGSVNTTVYASLVSSPPVPGTSVYLTQASADARYVQSPGAFSSTTAESRPADAAAAGVLTTYSRGDHVHDREQISGTDAARLALAGTDLYNGLLFFTTDTKRLWTYVNATWKLLSASNPPHCSLYLETSQVITNNTITAISYGAGLSTELVDTDSMHNPASNPSRVLLPFVGRWQISYAARMQTNATGVRLTYVALNAVGARFAWVESLGSASIACHHSSSFTLTTTLTTDYVELYVYQTSGGNLNADGSTSIGLNFCNKLDAIYLGPVF